MGGPKKEEAKQKRKETKKRKEAHQATIDDAAKAIMALQPCVKCGQINDEIKSLKRSLGERRSK